MNGVGEGATESSRWRIELARELSKYYTSRDGVRMVVLGGSPPKGLSDEYSDLDVIVYWDEVDREWLDADPLAELDRKRIFFTRMGESDVYLESHYFGTLKADFGHVTMAGWKEMVDDVLVNHNTEPPAQGPLGGFLASLPLSGEALFEEWRARVADYPEPLAPKMVRTNLRLFVRGYLLHQAFGREELLAYYDGTARMLKALLNILCGLNRTYAFTEEPRWIEYYLSRMSLRPERAWERMKLALSGGSDADETLEGLLEDVLSLVERKMPEVDVDRIRRRRKELRVRPTGEMPELRPKRS